MLVSQSWLRGYPGVLDLFVCLFVSGGNHNPPLSKLYSFVSFYLSFIEQFDWLLELNGFNGHLSDSRTSVYNVSRRNKKADGSNN